VKNQLQKQCHHLIIMQSFSDTKRTQKKQVHICKTSSKSYQLPHTKAHISPKKW